MHLGIVFVSYKKTSLVKTRLDNQVGFLKLYNIDPRLVYLNRNGDWSWWPLIFGLSALISLLIIIKYNLLYFTPHQVSILLILYLNSISLTYYLIIRDRIDNSNNEIMHFVLPSLEEME